MTMLNDYLISTRIGRAESLDLISGLGYHRIFFLCNEFYKELTKSTGDDFEQLVVYTMNRMCEMIKIGDSYALVYDKYLGQTLNSFNRVLTWAEDITSSLYILSKIAAEEAVLAGQGRLSHLAMERTESFRKYWKLPPAVHNKDVARQTQLQESYIIAHEYCHLLIIKNPDFATSRRSIGSMLTEPKAKWSPAELDRMAPLLKQRYGTDISTTELERQDAVKIQEEETFGPDLVDELACDDFALNVLIRICLKDNVDTIEAFKAAFLVLRNIRAWNYIKTAVRQVADSGMSYDSITGFDYRVKAMQIRQHKLRDAFPIIALSAGLGITRLDLHNTITDLSDRHDKVIDNAALFHFIPNFRNECRKFSVNPDPGMSFDNLMLSRAVCESMGWVPEGDNVPSLDMRKWSSDNVSARQSGERKGA